MDLTIGTWFLLGKTSRGVSRGVHLTAMRVYNSKYLTRLFYKRYNVNSRRRLERAHAHAPS